MTDRAETTEAAIRAIAGEQWAALGGRSDCLQADFHDFTLLPGPFGVTQLGAAALATFGAAVSELLAEAGFAAPRTLIDVGLTSAWLTMPVPSIPVGWDRPRPWSDVTLDYASADGRWVRLQANYPHLRRAVAEALQAPETPEGFAAAFEKLDADEAERLIVEHGGAAAATRTADEWAAHPQGRAVAGERLVDVTDGDAIDDAWAPRADRPLIGLRVLDVTRVLAGPTGTKFLAGLGAEVLRIDPPGYAEPQGDSGGDLMLGKRGAFLELDTDAGRQRFLELLADADVLVHGLRADAFDRLGLGSEVRARARPGLIEVTLNAYGWTGPWAARRGFDTLVQTSAGFSMAMKEHLGLEGPRLLPAQVLDLGTGYLIAAAAIRGVTKRLTERRGSSWRLSLARSARHIRPQEEPSPADALKTPVTGPVEDVAHWTPGGPVRRLRKPIEIAGVPIFWEYPGDPYGSASPRWVGHHSRSWR